MDRSQYIILAHCKKGEFQIAFELVLQHWESDFGIKLLVNCCHACLNNGKNICPDSLYQLLNHIVPTIGNPNEQELVQYFQSLYHILNFLIETDKLYIMVRMEETLLPHFLPPSLSQKLKQTFNSIAVILYNVVSKCAVAKDSSKTMFMSKISLLVSKISSKALEPLESLTRSFKSLTNLDCLNISVEEKQEYYKEVLLLFLTSYDDKKKGDCLKIIMNSSSMILKNILMKNEFQEAWDFVQNISETFESKSGFQEFVSLHQVLKFCLVMSPIKIGNENEELAKCKESLDLLRGESDFLEKLRETLLILLRIVTQYYRTIKKNGWTALPESLQIDIMYFIAGLTKEHHTHSLLSLQIVLYLMEAQMCQKPSSSHHFHEKCLEILDVLSNQMISLKDQNKDAWKKLWNTMGVKLFNTGIKLSRNTNAQSAMLYLRFFLQAHLTLENKNGPAVLEQPPLSSCLKLICEIHSEEPKGHLTHLALAIHLCPTSRDIFINNWINSKHSSKAKELPGWEEIQEITLVSALELLRKQSPLKELVGDVDELSLLKYELEQYKRKWKSKMPVSAVLKEIHKVAADIGDKVEIVVGSFGDCEMPLHEDCAAIMADLLHTYRARTERTKNSKSKINLGYLYYITYKYTIIQMIEKNAADMIRASMVDDEPTSHKDLMECNVVSTYENAILEKYLSNLDNLDKSLYIISSLVNESCSQVYNLLLQIYYDYRLLKHRIRCLQAAEAALKLAQLQNNVVRIVQMSGFIIEFSDLESKYLQEVRKAADALLDRPEFSKVENSRVVMIYYVCKSKALFGCNLKESYEAFQSCMELVERRKTDLEGIAAVRSQLHLLHFRFTALPCELGIEDRENTFLDVHNAAAMNKKEYGLDKSYDVSIILEANEEMIKLYHLMRCPRDVIAYGREILFLCQKLVSPLRSAIFLMYLAHADLRTNAISDCQVKLDSMANILCLFAASAENAMSSDSDEELSLPAERRQSRDVLSPSSPRLEKETFRSPPVVAHGCRCECFYCVCYEYQILVLEQTRLCALVNVKREDNSNAHTYFRGALKLYKYFYSNTIANHAKFASMFDCDIVPDFYKEFLASYGFILLNFSSHLDRNDKKDKALELNTKLIDLLVERKSDFVYLYNEAVAQKCVYATESMYPEPLRALANDMEYLTVNDVPDVPKTPESHFTKIFFPVECKTPDSSPPQQKMHKRLVFPLSPGEEVHQKRLQKSHMKTPAPKIQIYTETAEKKAPKRPQTSKKVPPATVSAGVDGGLKTRTRLLTDKLKQTTKNAGSGDVGATSKDRKVKKNLLQELGSSGDEPGTSKNCPSRKSTRNKK